MTLLEALAALVILGVTAVGYVSLMQESSAAARRADASSQVVAYAESSIAEAVVGGNRELSPLPAGFVRRVERRPWRAGVDELVVSVKRGDGAFVELHRLVRGR